MVNVFVRTVINIVVRWCDFHYVTDDNNGGNRSILGLRQEALLLFELTLQRYCSVENAIILSDPDEEKEDDGAPFTAEEVKKYRAEQLREQEAQHSAPDDDEWEKASPSPSPSWS